MKDDGIVRVEKMHTKLLDASSRKHSVDMKMMMTTMITKPPVDDPVQKSLEEKKEEEKKEEEKKASAGQEQHYRDAKNPSAMSDAVELEFVLSGTPSYAETVVRQSTHRKRDWKEKEKTLFICFVDTKKI